MCHCYGMKANDATSNEQNGKSKTKSQIHAHNFAKVVDGRKQPIRGLWIRGSRYYARLNLENPITGVKKTRRVPLIDKDGNAVETVAQAVAELKRLQTKRSENSLPTLTRTPKFSDYANGYLEFIGSGNGAKKPGTVEKETTILNRWIQFLGGLRVDQVKPVHVNRFIEARLKKKASARTINLDVIGLRVVLKRAKMEGYVQRLPTEELRPLKTTTEKRSLFTVADLDKFCRTAFETKTNERGKEVPLTENAQQIVDYIKFMAYSGARRNEALGVLWEDVDFANGQLFIRRQITSRGIEDLKNHETRVVDFNPKLKGHLLAMKDRLQNTSKWLFPSPQCGKKDIPAKSFRDSLELVRTQAKMPQFNFHDCRHHFISMCVMSGIDFMTIAAWVGHKDGGVLIGKVYGHLANEHRKAMAERLNFEPGTVHNAINN